MREKGTQVMLSTEKDLMSKHITWYTRGSLGRRGAGGMEWLPNKAPHSTQHRTPAQQGERPRGTPTATRSGVRGQMPQGAGLDREQVKSGQVKQALPRAGLPSTFSLRWRLRSLRDVGPPGILLVSRFLRGII